jgi:ADP-ribosylglycohydrolase
MEDPPGKINPELLDRIQGSIVGMALGDILGAHVEFRPHQFLKENPVKDLAGGGTWGLEKGQVLRERQILFHMIN